MDRTAQLREKYQSACKSYGSTCICRGKPQGSCGGRWHRPNRTGRAAVYTSSPSEPRPVMHRRRSRQKYRKPTGVISFVVPPPKSRGCHLVMPNATSRHVFYRRVDIGGLRVEKTECRKPPFLTQPVSRLSEPGLNRQIKIWRSAHKIVELPRLWLSHNRSPRHPLKQGALVRAASRSSSLPRRSKSRSRSWRRRASFCSLFCAGAFPRTICRSVSRPRAKYPLGAGRSFDRSAADGSIMWRISASRASE
jgi:hypothetical protein